jgi:hypothetical protein
MIAGNALSGLARSKISRDMAVIGNIEDLQVTYTIAAVDHGIFVAEDADEAIDHLASLNPTEPRWHCAQVYRVEYIPAHYWPRMTMADRDRLGAIGEDFHVLMPDDPALPLSLYDDGEETALIMAIAALEGAHVTVEADQ